MHKFNSNVGKEIEMLIILLPFQMLSDFKKQFADMLSDMKFLVSGNPKHHASNINSGENGIQINFKKYSFN